MLRSNPANIWQSLSPRASSNLIHHLDVDDQVTSVEQSLTQLNNLFTYVFKPVYTVNLPTVPSLNCQVIEAITVFSLGIIKIIDTLKFYSSAGVDNTNPKILKNAA